MSAENVLGIAERRNRDWLDENITGVRALLEAKNKAHKASLNARVGSAHLTRYGVLGRNGIETINANGYRLLSLCSQNQLKITNTLLTTYDI